MIPDAFPLLVREPNHSIYIGSTAVGNFEIGSNQFERQSVIGLSRGRPCN